jgi:hypothetical protein
MLGGRFFFLVEQRMVAKTGLNWSWIDGLYNTCTDDCLFVYAMAPGNAPPDGSWSMGSCGMCECYRSRHIPGPVAPNSSLSRAFIIIESARWLIFRRRGAFRSVASSFLRLCGSIWRQVGGSRSIASFSFALWSIIYIYIRLEYPKIIMQTNIHEHTSVNPSCGLP